jgi:hypothetical protein
LRSNFQGQGTMPKLQTRCKREKAKMEAAQVYVWSRSLEFWRLGVAHVAGQAD